MALLFRRKNALEQADFVLAEEGFSCRGLTYGFKDVIQTTRFRRRLEIKYVAAGSFIEHHISVRFLMATGEEVILTEEPTFFSSGRPENVERIEEIFETISAKSFDVRAQKYLKQLEEREYFEYAGWHFYPDRHRIINTETKRAYSTQSAMLLKHYGCIEVREPAKGMLATIGGVFREGVGISTLQDTDVFFVLLKVYFGLTWTARAA